MAKGEYSIENIPVGEYNVTASKEGCVSQTKIVTVIGGEITTVDFQLVPISVKVTLTANHPANLYIDGVFKGP